MVAILLPSRIISKFINEYQNEYQILEGSNVEAILEFVENFLDRGMNALLCWKREHLSDNPLRLSVRRIATAR